MAILAALCLAFGVLPTYVIPALGSALNPLAGASAADALVPPFFASNPAHDTLPPAFVEDFTIWAHRSDKLFCPDAAWSCCIAAGRKIPSSLRCPLPTCWSR